MAGLALWWRAWVPWSPPVFAWQVWHLATPTFVAGVALAARLLAGAALGDINLHFACQAWHLATSSFTLRGRHGAWQHRPSLCIAGVVLTALDRFAWHACHLAGVALGEIDLHFAWQACYLWHWAVSGGAHTTHTALSLTHNFVTHHLCHTPSLSHTIFHTTLSHAIFHTHLVTRHFVTHTHTTLSHTVFHTQLCHTHTHCTHNTVTTQLCHTHLFTYIFFTDCCSTTSFVFPSFPVPLELLFLLLEGVDLWRYPVL